MILKQEMWDKLSKVAVVLQFFYETIVFCLIYTIPHIAWVFNKYKDDEFLKKTVKAIEDKLI